MASTNVTDLAYVLETTPGTTPATPAFQRLPITGCDLSDNLTTAVSEVLRKDRMVDDVVIVDSEVTGPVPYELSYTPYKPLMIALLQAAAAVADVTISAATDIAAVNADSQFTSSSTDFDAAGVVVGMKIRVAGFTEDANNGLFTVTAVATNAITVSETLTDEAAGDSVTIDGECYRNGTGTPNSYTFRKSFSIPGSDEVIFYYRGCQISQMNFSFETGAILSGEITVSGLTAEGTTTAISGETITEVPDYTLMNSVSSVTNVSLTGLPDTAFFQTLDLTVNNNANLQKGIGQLGARGIANFTLEITGSITMYFEDLTLYTKYKNSTSFSVSMTLEDGDGNQIVITMPKCKFTELSEPVSGKDQFLNEEGSFQALRDSTTDCEIQFDFFPAV